MTDQIPNALLKTISNGDAILFLGAGASFGAIHPNNKTVPSGKNLCHMLCDEFLDGELKQLGLAEVAEYCINESNIIKVQTYIKEIFELFQPAAHHNKIPTFNWHSIFTTNYDLIIERAYENVPNKLQTVIPFFKNRQHIEHELKNVTNGLQYNKLHGCINHIHDTEIPLILTSEQYAKYSNNRDRLFGRLRDFGQEIPIIFCGYSLTDPNLSQIMHELFDEGNYRPNYYMVSPSFSDIEMRYWAAKRVVPIKLAFSDFIDKLDQNITVNNRALGSLIGQKNTTLNNFLISKSFVESDELSAFFEKDVLHVRPNMPYEKANAKEFYRGAENGWGPLVLDYDFHRKVTDQLVIDTIFPDESDRDNVDFFVVKGPGGNGKTVVLKRAALMAANDYDKLVLFFNDGAAIRYNVIKEIYQNTKTRIFFFCDRAAFYVDELDGLIKFAKANNIKLTLIVAERDAEWNVRCEKLDQHLTAEYPVKYLSEKEVDLLLEKLEKYNSLGLLEGYSIEQRRKVFTKDAQRQLLVALHEATRGKPFEEIIHEEYNRIIPKAAQELYLDICTFDRFGNGVRAGVISRVSGVTFTEFQKRLFRPLEYLVETRRDKYSGDLSYFARHQKVAEFVFNSVLTNPEEKYDQLVRIMQGLDISFSSDSFAFSQLVRGKSIKSMFKSQELGRRFYDVAMKVGGGEAFLYQQRAIFEMDHVGGDISLAEKYLKQATSMEPYNKSIQHSMALLQRNKAQDTSDPLLRKHYRSQAQTQINSLDVGNGGNSYTVHTAGQLALDELKDLMSENGDNSYADKTDRNIISLVKRVETCIQGGLQRFPQNPQILTLEADFRVTIDQFPRAEEALKQAFRANPRQDWIAVRLSKMLTERNLFDEAIGVMKKCIQNNPSSKLAHFKLGMLLDEHGGIEDSKQAIHHFVRGFTNGDDNFSAQSWYARALFLTQEYSDAKDLFAKLRDAAISPKTKNQIYGVIKDKSGNERMHKGKIKSISESYAFITCLEFNEDLFAHISSYSMEEWDTLQSEQSILFSVGFNMKGPCVYHFNPM